MLPHDFQASMVKIVSLVQKSTGDRNDHGYPSIQHLNVILKSIFIKPFNVTVGHYLSHLMCKALFLEKVVHSFSFEVDVFVFQSRARFWWSNPLQAACATTSPAIEESCDAANIPQWHNIQKQNVEPVQSSGPRKRSYCLL